jgi:hypothetical protein
MSKANGIYREENANHAVSVDFGIATAPCWSSLRLFLWAARFIGRFSTVMVGCGDWFNGYQRFRRI